MTHPYFDGPKPLRIAHRGGAAVWPENTLVAFQGALDLGYRHIETDTHLTRDGHLVLFHDATLDRTTNGFGHVEDLSLAELKELDAGYRFTPDGGLTFPFRGKGVTVPTVDEALALSSELKLNLELKQDVPDMTGPMWRFIEERGLHDRVLVASADDSVGRRFRKLARGRVVTSPGVTGILAFWLAVRSRTHKLLRFPFDALQVPPTQGPLTVVDEAFVAAAHHHGIEVHCWTINDAPEMRRLAALGVDGLMTDYPTLLLDTMASAG